MRMNPWTSILIVLAGVACHRPNPDEIAPTGAKVHVEVQNQYALPVEISATGSGTTYRLGVVHPGMKAHFIVPPALVGGGTVELTATPGPEGQVYRSGPLLVSPGRTIDLRVAQVLFSSTASIRP